MSDADHWISTREAADPMGVAVGHENYLTRTGRLQAWRQEGQQRRLLRSEVEALTEERAQWVSYVDAAEIIGRPRGTVRAMVRAGRLEQRHAGSPAVAEREAARAERPDEAAPDDAHEWIGPASAGELLGTTANGAR